LQLSVGNSRSAPPSADWNQNRDSETVHEESRKRQHPVGVQQWEENKSERSNTRQLTESFAVLAINEEASPGQTKETKGGHTFSFAGKTDLDLD